MKMNMHDPEIENPREIKRAKKAQKKAAKIARKKAKKKEKYLYKLENRREKAALLLEKFNAKLDDINKSCFSETKPGKIKKLNKKRRKIEARIKKVNVSMITKNQRSETDALRVNLSNFRIWVIILLVLIFITICIAAVWLYFKYEDVSFFQGHYYSEQQRSSDLSHDIETLKSEISKLNGEVSALKSENSKLESKASWFDRNCKIVIADEGPLYKTYHTYDCEKSFDRYWVYNKAQVVNKSEYKKCPDCN